MSRTDDPTVLPDGDDEITTDVDPAWVASIRAETRGSAPSAWSGGRRRRWRGQRRGLGTRRADVGSRGDRRCVRRPDRADPPGSARRPVPAGRHPDTGTTCALGSRTLRVLGHGPRGRGASATAVHRGATGRRGARSRVDHPRCAVRGRGPDRSRGAERRRTHLDHGAVGATSTPRRDCARDRNSADHPIDTPRARPDEGS